MPEAVAAMPTSSASAGTAAAASGGGSEATVYRAGSTTGLAVAATCKRMKVFSRLDPGRGVVTLDARELSRWLISKRNYDLAPGGASAGDASASGSGSAPGSGEGSGGGGAPAVLGRAAPSMMTLPSVMLAEPAMTLVDGGRPAAAAAAASGSDSDSISTLLSLDDDIDHLLPSSAGSAAASAGSPLRPQHARARQAEATGLQRRVYRQRQQETPASPSST